MGREKDKFWGQHAVDLENGRFSCNYCHGKFKGGANRMKWHLSGVKGHDIKVCEKVSHEVQVVARKALDAPKKKNKKVKYENCSIPSSSGGQNLNMENDIKCQLLDKQLAKWFFSSGINPKAIDHPIFKDFVKSIGEYGSSYQLPSLHTLEEELMKDVRQEVEGYVTKFKSDQASCTLIINSVFGGTFAYSQTGVVCLESSQFGVSLDCILEGISSTIKSLGPNRVVQLLIGGSFGWRREIREEIGNRHPRIILRCCAVEVIDRSFYDLFYDWEMQSTSTLVKFIFYAYYHYNVSFRREMKIPRENSASILLMLKSILNIEEELQKVSFSSMVKSSEEDKAAHFILAKLLDYIIGQKEFWSRVKLVTQVWDLLIQTRCLARLDHSSIGYLYQMMERAKDGIKKCREQDHIQFNRCWEIFSDMREKIIHPIHAVAASLDPAYMYAGNFEKDAEKNDEMMKGLNYMVENMIDSDEKVTFLKEFAQYYQKLPELFTPLAKKMLKEYHPRTWWNIFGKLKVPVLSKYALEILSQPCSTSFYKRYQVLECGILGDWRKINSVIMNENSKSLKLEPIILDKLGEYVGEFEHRTEQDFEKCFSGLLFIEDDFVYSVINNSSPFWKNVDERVDDFKMLI